MDLEMHPPQEPAHPPADLSSFGLPATSSASREPTFYDRYKKFFIIAGAGAGVVIGLIAKASEASSDTLLLIGYAGELYINALMLMVVPYICCSMLVSQRPDLSSTDSSGMGKTALACYACTTALAVVEALIFTNIFAPGDIGVPAHHGKQEPKRIDLHDLKFYSMQDDRGRSYIVADTSFSNSSFQSMVVTGHPSEELWALPSGTGTAMESILSIGNQILPRNVIKTYYSTNLLGLIVFNLLLGQAIAKQPREKSEPVFDGIATVADALMSVVLAVVEFTPIGIGSLIAKGMGNPNDNDMAPYLMFIVMALSAQACHMCLLGAALKTLSNINVPMYYSNLRPAMMMAIATDSSAAALPVTMACGQTNRLHQRTIDLVFPLGATVNMDGSTIYYVQAVIFMSAVSGWSMDFASQVQVGVTGALICCGAAPIPGGFIVFIWMIINLADVPAHVDMEQLQSSLSVLLAINWFMDRCRTTVNIVGDSVVAGIVEYKIYGPRAFEGAKPTLDPLGSPMPKAEGQLEHQLSSSSDAV